MSNLSRRSTIYFDPDVHRALRLKAASTDRAVSDLVNEAVRRSLAEDHEDLAAVADRVAEPTMTYDELLEKAFEEASHLPDEEQDSFARWLLEELRSEHRWAETFASSQSELARMAEEALRQHRNGETSDLHLDD